MKYNSDFKYDLEVSQVKEKELGELLGKTIEVKRDKKALKTGNFFIEYESRGKKSGLCTTQADYYAFAFGEIFIIAKTQTVKDLSAKYWKTWRNTVGGDNNTSKGILLPITDLIKNEKSNS